MISPSLSHTRGEEISQIETSQYPATQARGDYVAHLFLGNVYYSYFPYLCILHLFYVLQIIVRDYPE